MRKLGEGQSVVFLINQEIETNIRKVKDQPTNTEITVDDVVHWSITETGSQTKRLLGSWAAQGRRFAEHQELWAKAGEDLSTLDRNLAIRFLENGGRGLESRYGPDDDGIRDRTQELTQNQLINEINEYCRNFEEQVELVDALDDEQENELEKEGEREQQLAPELEQQASTQRPLPVQPREHTLSQHLLNFVKTGIIPKEHRGFEWAFETFLDRNLRSFIPKTKPLSGLRVTGDFSRTIKSVVIQDVDGCSDDFQRSVQWVLLGGPSGKPARHMVVISPFEASQLVNEIRSSACVSLHLYAPRQNKAFQPLDDLGLHMITGRQEKFVVPRQLQIELNIFSGQLYFRDFQEYIDTCEFLGLESPLTKCDAPGMEIESDGFIKITDEKLYSRPLCRFNASPVKEIKALVSRIRRDGGGIEKTHMGKLLNGQKLREDDFDGRPKRSADEMSED